MNLRKAAIPTASLLATGAITWLLVNRERRNLLADRVVVITGSSRGLGLALAEAFGKAGARLVLAARDPEELNRAKALLARRTGKSSDEILAVPCDLTSANDARELIGEATRQFGRVDLLINNAGTMIVGPVENQSLENFRNAMDTNFFSALHCTLEVLPQMLARGSGTVVNITSIGGKVAVPHMLPYTASKFAMVGFSQGLHAELRPKGIHVLTVCPGLMRTGSHVRALFTGNRQEEYRWFALGATLPGVSTSARHAARRILRAVLERETEITITPQAAVAARLAQVSPATTAATLALVNRLLPDPSPGESQPVEGRDRRGKEPRLLTGLGDLAIARYNQSA